jgi:septum site-determining protein MinC
MSAAPKAMIEPFRLRGGNFNLLVLRLLDHRAEVVVPAVADQFRRAPGLLRNAPIVLGLSELEVDPSAVDFAALVRGLRAAEINPIGTTGGSPEMRAAAQAAGLAPLRAAAEAEAHAPPAAASAAPAPAPAPPPLAPGTQRPTLLVEHNIRAGQRIWAEGADCIVLGAVNAGGEVIADGHVHIYGPLRGRAIAGGGHNTEARIFALHFDPELVSIAGFYATREQLGNAPIGKAVQVRLRGEALSFDRLG